MQLPTCVRLLISGCLLCHTEETLTFGVIARAALATFFALILTVSFMSPTKVSSACQKVADQDLVNLLRKRVKADGSVEIATVEQGQRIEITKRFINELNKGVHAPVSRNIGDIRSIRLRQFTSLRRTLCLVHCLRALPCPLPLPP
jgi:hypothetical protein